MKENMSFSEVYEGLSFLENLQEVIKQKEEDDRKLRKYYEEHGMDFADIQTRIDQYMLMRGQIAEVIDIVDGMKVSM